MSKFKGDQLTDSMEFNGEEVDSINTSCTGDLNSSIYKAENLYYQYLRAVKFENAKEASDFSTAFMTF